jgi:hypothetical protein
MEEYRDNKAKQKDDTTNTATTTTATTATSTEEVIKAVNVETLTAVKFQTLMQDTGCKSAYSDLKKTDLAAPYIGKPALVTGAISYISDGKVGIKVDPRTVTYDVLIAFDNAQDSYDLQKNNAVTVKFNFQDVGGCFLPFSGDHGQVQK